MQYQEAGSKGSSPEELEAAQAQASQEQFLEEAKLVRALLHSEGFQVLQGRWALLLQSYRDELQDVRKSVEDMRVLQGKIAAFADVKFILEQYVQAEKESA